MRKFTLNKLRLLVLIFVIITKDKFLFALAADPVKPVLAWTFYKIHCPSTKEVLDDFRLSCWALVNVSHLII